MAEYFGRYFAITPDSGLLSRGLHLKLPLHHFALHDLNDCQIASDIGGMKRRCIVAAGSVAGLGVIFTIGKGWTLRNTSQRFGSPPALGTMARVVQLLCVR
jgi:hypothetical protein